MLFLKTAKQQNESLCGFEGGRCLKVNKSSYQWLNQIVALLIFFFARTACTSLCRGWLLLTELIFLCSKLDSHCPKVNLLWKWSMFTTGERRGQSERNHPPSAPWHMHHSSTETAEKYSQWMFNVWLHQGSRAAYRCYCEWKLHYVVSRCLLFPFLENWSNLLQKKVILYPMHFNKKLKKSLPMNVLV